MNVIQLGELEALSWGTSPADAEVGILAVHGRGGTAAGMARILDRLPDGLPPVTAILPQAVDNAWYPWPAASPLEQNAAAVEDSITAMLRALTDLQARGLPRERVVAMGFSQGACLLSELLLGEPAGAGLAGAALFAGGYIGPEGTPPPATGEHLARLPIRMSLAEADPFAPMRRAKETATAFLERGADVRLDIREGDDHEVTDEQIASLADLIRRVVTA